MNWAARVHPDVLKDDQVARSKDMNPVKMPCYLLLCAVLLSACSAIFRKPEPGIQVRERTSICFRLSEDAHPLEDAHIHALAAPADCFSMRCTRVYQKSGTAVLDQEAHRLDFETAFILSETKPLLGGCTPDCAGGGTLDFDLGPLEPDIYDVYLWGDMIGELSVTSGLPWRDQCLVGTDQD